MLFEVNETSNLKNNVTCFDMEWVLHGREVRAFFDEFWESNPIYIESNDEYYFDDFYRFLDIDSSILNLDIEKTDISIFSNQKRVKDIGRYFCSDDKLIKSKVHEAYFQEGCTLCIENMERVNPAIQNLCGALSNVFLNGVSTALFLGPPYSVGLDVHFDYYNAFILQLSGKKRWRVYSSVFDNPTCERDRFKIDRSSLSTPIIDIELKQGDVLYIPRGCPHEPFCVDSHSLHLTVGVKTHSWADVLYKSIEQLRDTESLFRQSLPPFDMLHNDTADIKEIFRTLIETLNDCEVLEDALWGLQESHYLNKPSLYLGEAAGTHEITLNTILTRKAGLKPLVRKKHGATEILIEGAKLNGPEYINDALSFIASNTTFRLSQICSSLSDESKLKLGIKLFNSGLVDIVD